LSGGADLREAIAALKAGCPVRIGSQTVLAVETATAELLSLCDPQTSAPLLLSGWRAAALGLANRREAADPAEPVLVKRTKWLDQRTARSIADAGLDGDRPPIGPLAPLSAQQTSEARAALRLARLSGLLPALWLVGDANAALQIDASSILDARPETTLVARAKLPLDDMPRTQVAVFRASDGEEHVALIIGAFAGQPPLVRLHSECLTGDVFGSLKCDCGPQLKEALRLIAESGGGVLLYMRQEGRGIGIGNKIRAYALQDRGFDTVDANLKLGFADDERDYEEAAAILLALGASSIRLLTNNPAKVEALQRAGIEVVERVGHHMPGNPHNADYLGTKRAKSGHIF
jgi:GTP cyclohydrolase II